MPFNDAISAMKGFFTIGSILYLLFFGAILYVVHHSQSMGIAFLLVSLYIIVPTMNDSIFAHLSLVFYALAFYSQITTKKAPQRQTSAARVYPAQAQSQSHKNHYRRATNTAATAISAMPIASIFDDDDFNYHHQYLHNDFDDDSVDYHHQYLHNELSRTTDPAYAYEIDNIWHGTSFDSTHHSIDDSFSCSSIGSMRSSSCDFNNDF